MCLQQRSDTPWLNAPVQTQLPQTGKRKWTVGERKNKGFWENPLRTLNESMQMHACHGWQKPLHEHTAMASVTVCEYVPKCLWIVFSQVLKSKQKCCVAHIKVNKKNEGVSEGWALWIACPWQAQGFSSFVKAFEKEFQVSWFAVCVLDRIDCLNVRVWEQLQTTYFS